MLPFAGFSSLDSQRLFFNRLDHAIKSWGDLIIVAVEYDKHIGYPCSEVECSNVASKPAYEKID